MGNDAEKPQAVRIIRKDRLAPVATRGDVIDGAGKFYAERASYSGTLRRIKAKDKA